MNLGRNNFSAPKTCSEFVNSEMHSAQKKTAIQLG